MKKLKNVFIIVLAFLLASAKSDDLFQMANYFKTQKNLGKALSIYEEALNESLKEGNEAKVKLATKELGMLNFQLKNYIKSEWYFDQLINDENCDEQVLYKYARLQQINGRLDRAIQYYTKWGKIDGNTVRAKSYSDFCELIKRGEGVDNDIQVNSMAFNTKAYDEYSPCVSNGKLIFTSNKSSKYESIKDNNGQYFADLYQSLNLDYKGDKTTSLFSKSLKTLYNESSATFSKDGNTIYFTGNNLQKSNVTSNYTLCIYTSNYDGFKWSKPIKLEFVLPDNNYAFPSLSTDGNTLYFSSDMPNGAGGMDLYRSEFKNGKWGTPSNLGDHVNSPENEVYPFFLEDNSNQTLYFSSDGQPGYGGFDVFSTTLVGGMPQNTAMVLPSPINSSYDDFGYWSSTSQTFGYLSSNREGSDDIFYFKKTDDILEPKAKTKDEIVIKKTIEDEVTVKDEEVIVKKEKEAEKEVNEEEIISKDRMDDTKGKPYIPEEKKEEIKKESIPTKKTETKKDKTPPKKEETKKEGSKKEVITKPKGNVSSSIIEATNNSNYYMIVSSAYSLNDIQTIKNTRYPKADIIHSENGFYMLGFLLADNVDEADRKYKARDKKLNHAWFYFPKSQ